MYFNIISLISLISFQYIKLLLLIMLSNKKLTWEEELDLLPTILLLIKLMLLLTLLSLVCLKESSSIRKKILK